MRNTKSFLAVSLLLASFSLSACSTTAMNSVLQAAIQDRVTEDLIIDLRIEKDFAEKLAEIDKELVMDVSFDVWEQRVLLTGVLDSAQSINQVLAIASADNRIKTIYNEILLVTKEQRAKRRKQNEQKDQPSSDGIMQTVSDFWLETKIKGQLVTSDDVFSVNYRWRSVMNTIYIIGRARTQKELDIVLTFIRETEGVKDVKYFIEIKPVE